MWLKYHVTPNCHRIEKEFIYRKEKQSQDNAAMAVSQYFILLSMSTTHNVINDSVFILSILSPHRNSVQKTMSSVKDYWCSKRLVPFATGR